MKSKHQLMAEEILSATPVTIVDIGYAQAPNNFFKNAKVYGIDIVEASAPYEKTFRCDLNIDKLPFEDGEVDAVAMGCTLAHVANPLRLMGEINRILKQGGMLVVTSPNPNYYWESVVNIFYDYFKKRVAKAKHEEHFFEFSRYNMRATAHRAGFEVVKEIGYLLQLVKLHWRFGMEKRPGFAYEIIYVLKKTGPLQSYATFEPMTGGIERINTSLFT